MLRTILLFSLALWVLSGCGEVPLPDVAPETADVGDGIKIAGSSTVGPITIAVRDGFQELNPASDIEVEILGTGGGFKKFCVGETDISNASRPIKPEEAAQCAQAGIEYIELPVAFDGIAVLTNPANDFVDCLTSEELQRIWKPSAAKGAVDQLTNWQQVRGEFADQELVLYGPGIDSGTFDYFTEAIVGDETSSRRDFLGSEDDEILVDQISSYNQALGFMGFSYYDQNRDRLKLLAIDHDGRGCVEPNIETVARGLYQPLSRPLFIYINSTRIAGKPIIGEFVNFYLDNAPDMIDNVGYIPLTQEIYDLARDRYDKRITGSVFAEGGANVGVSNASLVDLMLQQQQSE